METDIEIDNLNAERDLPYSCKACGHLAASKEELSDHIHEAHGKLSPIGRSSLASSIASLALRGFLGSVMIMHGLPKLGEKKEETIQHMQEDGVPKQATVSASLLEVVGGASLLVGFMVPVVSGLFAAEMVGTAYINKEKMGTKFLSDGKEPSYELDVMYALAFSTLAVIGGGDFSLDRVLGL